ncbi:uncharacterized protein LOC123312478 [Coccinella septempunctata]|uniref:uncharacterized protein LOC123312478 n=1 Tax=Coccinella septempunctata TaxID=41139 RepID=UPI001D08D8DD|nr:uncharacterized protein LOC123312478 [Coccinella septempunctata]
MGIFKEVVLCVTIILAASCESRPISLHNYAPAHEYKSTDYSFSYGVKDPHTGDVKNQWEEKKDNVVRGEYSLVEADGSTRTVQYTADDKNGFNAVVKYDQHSVHPITENKAAVSHNNLNLNPSKETSVAYSSYSSNLEGLSSHGQTEVQTVVQHEYKLPESYSEIQSLAIQHLNSLSENQQIENQQVQNQHQPAYYYVQQQETASEENTKSEQVEPQPQVQSYYAYEPNQNNGQIQDEEQHESQQQEVKEIVENQKQNDDNAQYEVNNAQAQLPLTLNVLPDSANKVPVDINVLNPINIDLTHLLKNSDGNQESGETIKYSTKDNSVQPSHQFTPEEVQKFIDDYNKKLGEPVYETGFVPITTKPSHLITQPMVPNTYKSNLKVNMTPGLKHYSSRGNSKFRRNKYETLLLSQQQLLPLLYKTGELRKDGRRTEYNRLHRSVPNRNQLVRYAKHIRFLR